MTKYERTLESDYADLWYDTINEIYTGAEETIEFILAGDKEAEKRALVKAAECLRYGATHTFTGEELDVVRYLMPAHEVHQSGSASWVNRRYSEIVVDSGDWGIEVRCKS